MERLVRIGVAGAGAAVTAAATVLTLTAGAAHGARATSRTLATFTTPGDHSWTVPMGVSTVTFDVFGASGGNAANGDVLLSKGGAGGEARARFAVKPGQRFEIVVGGSGERGSTDGAFNGGGSPGGGEAGYGGGGSDVRIGGIGNPCAWKKSCGYSDRIVVGGGGGGGGMSGGGGAGGGISGAAGASGDSAGGGQESVGCEGGMFLGCFGPGGGRPQGEVDGAGGGGGGWYGGNETSYSNGGGGGSGFISRFALSGSFPGGTRIGAGRVVISTP